MDVLTVKSYIVDKDTYLPFKYNLFSKYNQGLGWRTPRLEITC